MTKSYTYALALLLVGAILPLSQAGAVSISYQTPAGSTAGGQPVDAKATFLTGTNLLTITLENLQANPTSVIQNLSDLRFTLSNSELVTASFAAAGNSAQERSVAADGTFVNGATLTTGAGIGWVLSNTGAGQFYLNDLGAGGAGPEHTLLGPPDGANVYSNANASIAGNDPHNPFLAQTITWALDIIGLTGEATVTAAVFSFGTESGVEIAGVQQTPAIPEPSTFLLVSLGLAGLETWRRRKCRSLGQKESSLVGSGHVEM